MELSSPNNNFQEKTFPAQKMKKSYSEKFYYILGKETF